MLPPDTPVRVEDFVLVLTGPNARVFDERFNVSQNDWTHRLRNQLQELRTNKLLARFPEISAVSIIDKCKRRVRQVAADKFCLSLDNVSVPFFTLAERFLGLLALGKINGKHDAAVRHTRKHSATDKHRYPAAVSPHVELLIGSTDPPCERLLNRLLIQMQLIRLCKSPATQLALVELGATQASQREISFICGCDAPLEVPDGNRNHVAFINAPKLGVALS